MNPPDNPFLYNAKKEVTAMVNILSLGKGLPGSLHDNDAARPNKPLDTALCLDFFLEVIPPPERTTYLVVSQEPSDVTWYVSAGPEW